MPHYKDPSNNVHFLDSDEFEHLLPEGCTQIDEETAAGLLAPTEAQRWAKVQSSARSAMDASDMTALRCFKAGVPFPAEWIAYVNQLRAIVRAQTGDPDLPLPEKPAYPAGT